MSADDTSEISTIHIRFLRHLLDRLEALAHEPVPWDGIARLHAAVNARLRALTETGAPGHDIGGVRGRAVPIAVELHRLRRSRTAVTITVVGGHRHRGLIGAVGRRHTVVHQVDDRGRARVLVPLRFIESAHCAARR